MTELSVTENRHKYVGGSDMPAILGISKYKTQFQLAKEKVGIEKAEFVQNEYADYGNIMEPHIRDYINAVNNTNFIVDKRIKDNIRGNCDGFDQDHSIILEIKTHGTQPRDEEYICQMQLYMYLFDAEAAWLAKYHRPKDFDIEFDSERLIVEPIQRDDEHIKKILEAIELFWSRCEVLRNQPTMSEVDFYNIGVDGDLRPVIYQVQRFEDEMEQLKKIEKKHKALKETLYEEMEKRDLKSFDAGNVKLTRILPTTSLRFDSKSFKEYEPDLHDQYLKETERKGYVKITVSK